MNDIVGYLILTLFLISFVYAFIRQIGDTINVRKIIKPDNSKYTRILFGNYICIASYGLFIIFFVLNGLVSLEILKTSSITSENTFSACLIFLTLIFASKYIIVPKD
ncbi:hypothetical protein G9F72_003085 [Clostridium estertheticum]|uniref:hypothetical protein n=1 Tax=Clostridium estertheticum TaxID=238834 RepID=UPI0013E994B0|nr:hypothetical protein [Clostridium estertheticum]MBZ9685334.1 hypothetical protein [Clostridium estertheticum]